eukprot:g36844.t1
MKLVFPENIEEIKRDYTGWRTVKPLFDASADLWETVKGNIKRLQILSKVITNRVRSAQGLQFTLTKPVLCQDPTMWNVLSKMGLQEEIQNWIRLLYTNIVIAVSINGWESKSFPNRSRVRTDYLKVLGIWFEGARACAKTLEENITKIRQKLGFWEHRSLSIV